MLTRERVIELQDKIEIEIQRQAELQHQQVLSRQWQIKLSGELRRLVFLHIGEDSQTEPEV